MIKILIVEDDALKREAVSRALLEEPGVDANWIHRASSVAEARERLAAVAYDLLVLDISLPARWDVDAQPDGGMRLLDEIEARSALRMPAHIIGLTAYADIYTRVLERFSRRSHTLVAYDATTDDWRRPLLARVRHVLHFKEDSHPDPVGYGIDLGVVCALYHPELASLLRVGWEWEETYVASDSAIYYRAQYTSAAKSRQVVATTANAPGTATAVVSALNLIAAFKPRILAMVGIAAGVPGRVNIGDIVVADPSWEWPSGKYVDGEEGSRFLPAPRQLPLDRQLAQRAYAFSADTSALAQIQADWPANKPDTLIKLHVGPMATGGSVVADDSIVRSIIDDQHRKLLGIDMETYAMFAAAEGAPDPAPKAFSMKAVVDFADSAKNDEYHRYGAFTSAAALKVFAERYLD